MKKVIKKENNVIHLSDVSDNHIVIAYDDFQHTWKILKKVDHMYSWHPFHNKMNMNSIELTAFSVLEDALEVFEDVFVFKNIFTFFQEAHLLLKQKPCFEKVNDRLYFQNFNKMELKEAEEVKELPEAKEEFDDDDISFGNWLKNEENGVEKKKRQRHPAYFIVKDFFDKHKKQKNETNEKFLQRMNSKVDYNVFYQRVITGWDPMKAMQEPKKR